MRTRKRFLSTLLTLALLLSLLPTTALAAEETSLYTNSIENTEEVSFVEYVGEVETSALPIGWFSYADSKLFKATNEVNWIDRLDIGNTPDDLTRKFYSMLEEAADNDGTADFLIDDSYYAATPCTIDILSEDIATSEPYSETNLYARWGRNIQ